MTKAFKSVVSIHELPAVAEKLFALKNEVQVYTFEGPLGAGKTTLIQLLLKQWHITEPVTSPTFNYVNVYTTPFQTLYHFDLYRLTTLEQFIEAGFDQMLYQENSWSFIEWPTVIAPLLTHNVCKVSLDHYTTNQRIISYCIL